MSGNATTPPTINQSSAFVLTASGDLSQYGMNTLLEMEAQITAAQANITTLQGQGPVYLTSFVMEGPTSGGSQTTTWTTPANTTYANFVCIGGGGPGGNGGGSCGGGGSGAALFSGTFAIGGGAQIQVQAGGSGYLGVAGGESSISFTPAGSANSMFVCTALGGLPGQSGSSNGAGAPNQTGSTGSGTYFGALGDSGHNSVTLSNAWVAGAGGGSALGAGGGIIIVPLNTNAGGNTGPFYGTGGSGGTGSATGGNGGVGYIKIDCFGFA